MVAFSYCKCGLLFLLQAVKILPIKIKRETTPIKVTVSKESTPDMEIKTPTAKNQPDTVPLELDSILSSLNSDLEKEEQKEQHLPTQGFSKPSPKGHRKSLEVVNTTSPKSSPKSSPHLNKRAEGSPSTLKKKSATIASAQDVELRMHNSSPNLSHRQSFPPREAEWIDKLFSPHKEDIPVFQQLSRNKHTDYTIKRQKMNIQAELEMIEDVRDVS